MREVWVEKLLTPSLVTRGGLGREVLIQGRIDKTKEGVDWDARCWSREEETRQRKGWWVRGGKIRQRSLRRWADGD